MKISVARVAVSAVVFSVASPAFADLIKVAGTQTTGTGLGAVSTLVTVQDNNKGKKQNGIESGCVSYAGNLGKPSESCALGLEGGDNHSGSAGNNLYLLSSIDGLTSAGQLGLVVNASEGAPGNTSSLTHLYLSLHQVGSLAQMNFAYLGTPLLLSDAGGIGQSGIHRFVLDQDQAAAANAFCPTLSMCVIGGGVQFAQRSTSATPDTVYVGAFQRLPTQVPEPFSLALVGLGLLGMGALRRRAG